MCVTWLHPQIRKSEKNLLERLFTVIHHLTPQQMEVGEEGWEIWGVLRPFGVLATGGGRGHEARGYSCELCV